MKKIARRDANHREIVECFRALGCSVLDLGSLGNGCPDILVGYGGLNVLVEIKDGSKPPSARCLTDDQIEFFCQWQGDKVVVTSIADCQVQHRVLQEKSGILAKEHAIVKGKSANERRQLASRGGCTKKDVLL